MRGRAQFAAFADGRRHFHDGPIDLILQAYGAPAQIAAAYAVAELRFVTVLDELCEELSLLRAPLTHNAPEPRGCVAKRMSRAVSRFSHLRFLTPMAAVAGAVAEEILGAMIGEAELTRAYVNDGGDIALHLAPDASFEVGMVGRPDHPALFGRATITGADSARGIATSGWRGRSFSLGIADAVTVIARDASTADAAATLIANAVDLPGHSSILRVPARSLDPQSDLGERLVTRDVGDLSDQDVETALTRGAVDAELFVRLGLIEAAALRMKDVTRLVGGKPDLYKSTLGTRELELAKS